MITWHTERTFDSERLRYAAHTSEDAGYTSPGTFCGHGGGYTYVVNQPTQDEPRLYTWGYSVSALADDEPVRAIDKHLEATGQSMAESTTLAICGRPPHNGSWGFTFVRLDP